MRTAASCPFRGRQTRMSLSPTNLSGTPGTAADLSARFATGTVGATVSRRLWGGSTPAGEFPFFLLSERSSRESGGGATELSQARLIRARRGGSVPRLAPIVLFVAALDAGPRTTRRPRQFTSAAASARTSIRFQRRRPNAWRCHALDEQDDVAHLVSARGSGELGSSPSDG